MIEKMKFVTLTGPEEDIDRVAAGYLSRHELHPENALTELPDRQNLRPFPSGNPYREMEDRLKSYLAMLPEDTRTAASSDSGSLFPKSRRDTAAHADTGNASDISQPGGRSHKSAAHADTGNASDIVLPGGRSHDSYLRPSEITELLSRLDAALLADQQKKQELQNERKKAEETRALLEPFRELPENLPHLMSYRFIGFGFGRFPRDFYDKFSDYIYESIDTIFYRSHSDDRYVYGILFAPVKEMHKIEAVYASMHFERIYLPSDLEGTPDEAYRTLSGTIEELDQKLAGVDRSIRETLTADASLLAAAGRQIETLSAHYEIRRHAALLTHENNNYYILCGWMADREAAALKAETESDDRIMCVVEESPSSGTTPPTKLRNPRLFRPYELYVEMYGLPNYRELDPTVFVALTYSFIFGAMFGDFGQGLCLLIGGFLLYRFRHIKLAGIVGCAGAFSTVFGLLFGSFFGFEDTVIHHLWLRPKEDVVTLPGIGTINTVLVSAIIFGMFLILSTMIFNILNSRRLGDKESMLFGTNSLAGFVFYVGVIIAVLRIFGTGGSLPAWFLIVFFAVPLVLMFLKEPLTRLVLKEPKETAEKESPVMFFVQSFFEMFETLLSFFSNTLSFVRIGAFAVSHAAMMEVVLMLAGATKGSPNWVVVVLGNLFVMGMEGLIVGIQVLRLEYYEMFSRFYRGDGKPFRSWKNA